MSDVDFESASPSDDTDAALPEPFGNSARTGQLTLGIVLASAGIDPSDALVIRHTFSEDGLAESDRFDQEKLRSYTRRQDILGKLGKNPPAVWLVFASDGRRSGRRSRFLGAYENYGEVIFERTESYRFFDLRDSDILSYLRNRLVIEWSVDALNWAKKGELAARFPLVEISDPAEKPFPGFDRLVISHSELQQMVETDSRYRDWRTALSQVQGIYLIADTGTGKHYVGKADGGERILGRWRAYARDGHGGNTELQALLEADPDHAKHFRYSLLQVFGPTATARQVEDAERHFKEALLTREFGLNGN